MHHTGEKESKKEKEKYNVRKNLLQGDSNLDPPNHRPNPLDRLGKQ